MTKNILKNKKNGAMNIFIYHIEKSQEELVEFFLIIKKGLGKRFWIYKGFRNKFYSNF